MSLVAIVAAVWAAVTFTIAAAFAIYGELERRRWERRQAEQALADERAASNGLYPRPPLERQAVTRNPPRPPQR